ncbi:MAG TPA: adenylate/guanylate cyclase domain-containing protein [Candidatus Limnocylindria bacterium]
MTLTFEELAAQSGVDRRVASELVRIGVTGAMSEPFEPADVQRVITGAAYLDAGFTLEQLRSAIESHTISFAFADALDLEPTERAGTTLGELAARLGEPIERLRAVYGAFGLPIPDAGTPLRANEEAVVAEFVDRWSVAGFEATIRAARIFGDNARRASEGWVDLFVEQVSMPAMSHSRSFEDYAESTIRPATALAELAPRLLVWLQLRHTSHAMLDANLRHFERDLVARGVIPQPDRQLPVIAFADLVGYTRLTESEGDARAVEAASHLQSLSEEAARGSGGRVIKLLGDGAMLRFDDVSAAADAMLALAEAASGPGLGAVHLGIECGPVVERDGDAFGRTVNLAARIAASAGPGELLAGPGAAPGLEHDPRFTTVSLGARELKGFAAPIPIWRVQSSAGR